ncbi:MAG: MBL fold metallo-hydrolase [Candidatus Pacebacteria bacterium]|nr:MBL fold metallo-hydrolase [Candidatus Paceibacterota bacterium]
MDISWYGHSFFEINGKIDGERVTIAIDPYGKSTGLRPKKTRTDILLLSHEHEDHSNKKAVSGFELDGKIKEPFLINEPGEYEAKGVKVKGISSFHDDNFGEERGENIIFIIEVEGIKVCHMGDFGQKELSKEQADDIVGVDVLLIPVGGLFTISGKEAAKIVGQVEPKIAIPMHYKIPGITLKIEDEKSFLNVIGVKEKEKFKKLKLKKSELDRKEGTEILIMEKT